MRNRAPRYLAIALIRIASLALLSADEPNFIISEWSPAIQMIQLESFSTWPGASGAVPVDAAFAGGRIILVFPETVVSLANSGDADERTLLALFATQSAVRGENPWSPSAGTVCPDGIWRSWNADGPELRERDLLTGLVRRVPWNGPPVDSLHALPAGRILVLSGDDAYVADQNGNAFVLAENLPPLSLRAVSAAEPRIAWMGASADGIRFADESGRRWERKISGGPFPAAAPWSMAWAGGMIATAWPGRIIALDGHPGGAEAPVRAFVLEDDRLPNRWYRLYGGAGRLMVHSPESGVVALLEPPSRPPVSGAPDANGQAEQRMPRFVDLVGEDALAAADLAEAEGGAPAAMRFCTWILPYVRKFRSEHPMEPLWPELESELTRRRAALMDQRD